MQVSLDGPPAMSSFIVIGAKTDVCEESFEVVVKTQHEESKLEGLESSFTTYLVPTPIPSQPAADCSLPSKTQGPCLHLHTKSGQPSRKNIQVGQVGGTCPTCPSKGEPLPGSGGIPADVSLLRWWHPALFVDEAPSHKYISEATGLPKSDVWMTRNFLLLNSSKTEIIFVPAPFRNSIPSD